MLSQLWKPGAVGTSPRQGIQVDAVDFFNVFTQSAFVSAAVDVLRHKAHTEIVIGSWTE